MARSILGNYEAIQRMTIINSTRGAWLIWEREINRLKSELYNYINDDSKENLDWSYQALIQSISTMTDENYILSENPFLFNEAIDSLHDTLRHLSMSYLVAIDEEHGADNAESLVNQYCISISNRYRAINTSQLWWGYPAVSKLIRFIRNLEEHQIRNRPTDVITNERSFGNIFTLTSLFILSVQAYIEICTIWLLVEQQENPEPNEPDHETPNELITMEQPEETASSQDLTEHDATEGVEPEETTERTDQDEPSDIPE